MQNPGRFIPVWAGVIWRFAVQMKVGDYVVHPRKADRTLSFGVVEGDFYVESGAELHPNRRRVKWIRNGAPREDFSKSALNEIGSAVTLGQYNSQCSVSLQIGFHVRGSCPLAFFWPGLAYHVLAWHHPMKQDL